MLFIQLDASGGGDGRPYTGRFFAGCWWYVEAGAAGSGCGAPCGCLPSLRAHCPATTVPCPRCVEAGAAGSGVGPLAGAFRPPSHAGCRCGPLAGAFRPDSTTLLIRIRERGLWGVHPGRCPEWPGVLPLSMEGDRCYDGRTSEQGKEREGWLQRSMSQGKGTPIVENPSASRAMIIRNPDRIL